MSRPSPVRATVHGPRARARARSSAREGAFECASHPRCAGCARVDAPLDPEVLTRVRAYFGDDHVTFRGSSTRWRCKAKLAAREGDHGVSLGLFARGTHDVVAMETCAVSHRAVDRAAALTRETCREMGVEAYDESSGRGELRYVQVVVQGVSSAGARNPSRDGERARASISLVWNASEMTKRIEDVCDDLARRGGREFVHGVWVNLQDARTNTIFNDRGWTHVRGERLTSLATPDGTPIYYLPGSFMQANAEAYGALLERMPRHVPRGARITEMYAGTGAIGFSLLMNAELDVQSLRCVESSSAVKEAWERTRDELPSGVKSKASLRVEKADRVVVESTKDCDVLIVDPPRKGLGATVRSALTSDTLSADLKVLMYVSCGFDSFQRDADELIRSGMWRLAHHESFIFFPATNHVEVFAVFERA